MYKYYIDTFTISFHFVLIYIVDRGNQGPHYFLLKKDIPCVVLVFTMEKWSKNPSVAHTGGKFLLALLKPVSNLPTVPGVVHVNLGKDVTGGFVDTGGKFTASV
jgi:hypothetical protein